MKKLSGKEIKEKLCCMLQSFDRICSENVFTYYLAYGSLLGAVRHGGFIPWDDDLDIMFTHENYELFFEACKTDLDKKRFFFQDFRSDFAYRWGYGKLRRLDSEYIKKGQEHLKQRTGVCIDIFDFQYLPDDAYARRLYQRKMFCIRKIMYSAIGAYAEDSALLRCGYRLLRLLPIQQVQRIRLAELNKRNHLRTKNMSCEMFPTPSAPDGYASAIFADYTEVDFEGMKFMAVKDYEQYLKVQYGDYMKLPPAEERRGVMNAVKYKLIELSYDALLKEYSENRALYCG